jgi:hypothetical protein
MCSSGLQRARRSLQFTGLCRMPNGSEWQLKLRVKVMLMVASRCSAMDIIVLLGCVALDVDAWWAYSSQAARLDLPRSEECGASAHDLWVGLLLTSESVPDKAKG